MTHNEKPARIARTMFGQKWRIITHWKDTGEGMFTAINTRDVHPESEAFLDEMADAHAWINGLMKATGKTRDEIAAEFDVVLTQKAD